ncbi:MAG: hypothetical protein DYG98_24275 [Haliscomenobacteraceae bacterium CHB4]|nr:hypothetical protein [Haliscomenobacteraceae bacterium CHB4]
MTAHTNPIIDYATLEKEWLVLSTPEEKADFWKRMKLLFANLDSRQIAIFFEQLQKSASDISLRLELAAQRAEMYGFKHDPS